MGLLRENDGSGLLIGLDRKTGEKLYYGDERGLATIAAPGSGKTEGHMVPNLLTWDGPAVVLDINGELYRRTSRARSRFGPVYKFDVEDTASSDHYNPFDAIRRDPRYVWGDALSFANLVHSRRPAGAEMRGSGFYEQAVPAYLAALTAYIVTKEDQHYRNGERLIRYASGATLDAFLAFARTSGIQALEATAAVLDKSDKETQGNVIWGAKNCLGPWDQPDIAELTRVSDWRPAMIRDHNATLYICTPVSQIINHPGLIRVILGQHLQAFMTRPYLDKGKHRRVQLFLDEVPQLRHLDQIVRAIEEGRNYGVRCWLVMQWRGQLVATYGKETAEGMLGACGLQAYMNPSLEDGMAQALSARLGEVDHPLDGTRRPYKTAQTLAGTEYADSVLAFEGGTVHRLQKYFQYRDKAARELEGAAP